MAGIVNNDPNVLPTLFQQPGPYHTYDPAQLNTLGSPLQGSGPYGTAPFNAPDQVWIQVVPYLYSDTNLQWWVNINTGDLVWGNTDLTANDNIHLYDPKSGADSGYQLDRVTSQISKNANILGIIFGVAAKLAGLIFGGSIAAGINLGASTTGALVGQPAPTRPPQAIPPTNVVPAGGAAAPSSSLLLFVGLAALFLFALRGDL